MIRGYKMHGVLLHVPIDIQEYLPEEKQESYRIVFPVRVTGMFCFHDSESLQVSMKGHFDLQIDSDFEKLKELSEKIGMEQIRREFIEYIWQGSWELKWLRSYMARKDEEQEQLLEEIA